MVGRQRHWQIKKDEANLCPQCGKKRSELYYCSSCYAKHKKRIQLMHQNCLQNNLCIICKQDKGDKTTKTCLPCLEKKRIRQRKDASKLKELKLCRRCKKTMSNEGFFSCFECRQKEKETRK